MQQCNDCNHIDWRDGGKQYQAWCALDGKEINCLECCDRFDPMKLCTNCIHFPLPVDGADQYQDICAVKVDFVSYDYRCDDIVLRPYVPTKKKKAVCGGKNKHKH